MRKSYRFSSKNRKLEALTNLIGKSFDDCGIGYLSLKSKSSVESEYCSEEYDCLYDLWDWLEEAKLTRCNLLVNRPKEPRDGKNYHCIGHKIKIRHGKILMIQNLI